MKGKRKTAARPRRKGARGTPASIARNLEAIGEHFTDGKILEYSDATKAKALIAFRKAGTVKEACVAAEIGRRTWYNWLEDDAMFAKQVFDATEDVSDELVAEAVKRAKDGSDTLLMFLLRSWRPEQYRETHKIEIVSPVVKENLRQTIAIINEELESEDAERILERLDKVWIAA